MSDVEEATKLFQVFKDLGAIPKFESPDGLCKWMADYVAQQQHSGDRREVTPLPPVVPNRPRPRLSVFSGDPPLSKSDVTYRQWKYEVTSYINDNVHTTDSIFEAVRLSLKGEPMQVLMRMKGVVTLETVLDKLDYVYNRVESAESLLKEFYSASQRDDETVSAWSLRLEGILDRAADRTAIGATRMDSMLRTTFYEGLKPVLRDISGHKFDGIKDFDQLRESIRQLEYSRGLGPKTGKPAQIKMMSSDKPTSASSTSSNCDISELKEMMLQLTSRFDALEKKGHSDSKTEHKGHGTSDSSNYPRGGKSKKRGGNRGQHYQSYATHPPYSQPYPSYGQSVGNGEEFYQPEMSPHSYPPPPSSARGHTYPPPPPPPAMETQPPQFDAGPQGPQCYRCGQYGHLQVGCRVIMDHSQRHLNSKRPMSGGYP